MISFSSDNEFFNGKTETFLVMRFFLELTQHTPPKGCQYIRRYGLYAQLSVHYEGDIAPRIRSVSLRESCSICRRRSARSCGTW